MYNNHKYHLFAKRLVIYYYNYMENMLILNSGYEVLLIDYLIPKIIDKLTPQLSSFSLM